MYYIVNEFDKQLHNYFVLENLDKIMHMFFNFDACIHPLGLCT